MPFGWFKRPRTAPAQAPVEAVAETPRELPARVEFPPDKIAARAYEIWVRRGKPPHAEVQNWLDAEAELRAEFAADPEPAAPIRKSR